MGEDEKLVSKTATHALYEILSAFRGIATETAPSRKLESVNAAWKQILSAEPGTVEFAHRHGEVMALWANAIDEIAYIKPERLAERLKKNSLSWWTIIVLPNHDWGSRLGGIDIQPEIIDFLATADDLLTEQFDGSPLVSAATDLEALREECQEWVSLLSDSDEITDESLRRVLQGQIEHLIWLIDNVGSFGLPRVVQQGDQVTGTLVRAGNQPEGVKKSQIVRQRIFKFIAALTLVANLVHSPQVIVDSAEHAITGAEKIVKELTDGHPGKEMPKDTSSPGENDAPTSSP